MNYTREPFPQALMPLQQDAARRNQPEGRKSLEQAKLAHSTSKLVEGGGFEPPKLTRQIYSLIPLATREPLPKRAYILFSGPVLVNRLKYLQSPKRRNWSWREESNPRPADYKSAALPTELRQP